VRAETPVRPPINAPVRRIFSRMATLARRRLATNRIIYSRLAALNASVLFYNSREREREREREKRNVYFEQKSKQSYFLVKQLILMLEDNQKCLISFNTPQAAISSRLCTYAFASASVKLFPALKRGIARQRPEKYCTTHSRTSVIYGNALARHARVVSDPRFAFDFSNRIVRERALVYRFVSWAFRKIGRALTPLRVLLS